MQVYSHHEYTQHPFLYARNKDAASHYATSSLRGWRPQSTVCESDTSSSRMLSLTARFLWWSWSLVIPLFGRNTPLVLQYLLDCICFAWRNLYGCRVDAFRSRLLSGTRRVDQHAITTGPAKNEGVHIIRFFNHLDNDYGFDYNYCPFPLRPANTTEFSRFPFGSR